jgi:tetratricopeptide (TPR) repeat protein
MRAFAALTLYVSLSLIQPPALVAGTEDPVVNQIRQARRSLASGNYADAESCLRDALTRTLTIEPQSVPGLRNALADLLREEGRTTEARQLYEETLRVPGTSAQVKFDAMAGIADVDGMGGAPEASVREWTDAIAFAREQQSIPLEAEALRGLGVVWLEAGNSARAEPLLRRALRMQENDASAQPEQISATLTQIGRCYLRLDKLALAEDALSRALRMGGRTFGEMHPQNAYIMERLAEVYASRKEFALARDYSSKAVQIMRACCGENSLAVAAALVNRATVEQRANALDAAAENYAGALRIARANPGNSFLESRIIERYAGVLKATHRNREAKELTAVTKSFRDQH